MGEEEQAEVEREEDTDAFAGLKKKSSGARAYGGEAGWADFD